MILQHALCIYSNLNRFGQTVFFLVGMIILPEVGTTGFNRTNRFMEIHVVLGGIHHTSSNVGAVVGNALQISQQIRPDKADLDRALAQLQALDVFDKIF